MRGWSIAFDPFSHSSRRQDGLNPEEGCFYIRRTAEEAGENASLDANVILVK
jgi:hypothetical protein